jgi:sentrin-specific protease 7
VELFKYPLGADAKDQIAMTRADFERLEPGEFLNDNLVDFYLKFLMIDSFASSAQLFC